MNSDNGISSRIFGTEQKGYLGHRDDAWAPWSLERLGTLTICTVKQLLDSRSTRALHRVRRLVMIPSASVYGVSGSATRKSFHLLRE